MAVYTVHEPPSRAGEPGDPARFTFVRDGFHFWAFVLGPLWMLRHRLWLVLIGYLVVAAALHIALIKLGVSDGLKIAVALLLALLVGLEAASLRRWTLGRRRWRNLGVVVADDLEQAERRFFDAWVAEAPRSEPSPRSQPSGQSTQSTRAASAAPPDVIGLFPQPGARP
jgi:hypothetical protein